MGWEGDVQPAFGRELRAKKGAVEGEGEKTQKRGGLWDGRRTKRNEWLPRDKYETGQKAAEGQVRNGSKGCRGKSTKRVKRLPGYTSLHLHLHLTARRVAVVTPHGALYF